MESLFLNARPGVAVDGHRIAYERGIRLMNANAAVVFYLDQETPETHERYGSTLFSSRAPAGPSIA